MHRLWILKDIGVHIKLTRSFSTCHIHLPRRCKRIQEPGHKEKGRCDSFINVSEKHLTLALRDDETCAEKQQVRPTAASYSRAASYSVSFLANSSDQHLLVWPELSYEIVFVCFEPFTVSTGAIRRFDSFVSFLHSLIVFVSLMIE